MEAVLSFAKGPLFTGCFAVLVLGLLRVLFITVWGMYQSLQQAGDKKVPYRVLLKETFEWLIPFKHISSSRALFSVVSFLFHIGLVLVPILLLDHILLWRRGIGLSWPSLPDALSDTLTLITIAAGLYLLVNRLVDKTSRFLSTGMDYLLLVLIEAVFITGYIASRPWSPLSNDTSMLIHVLCGDAILVLIPFTKLAHCVLYPLVRIASNIAWRFPARAGEAVNMTLYGEEKTKI